jgi:hypothetical protein
VAAVRTLKPSTFYVSLLQVAIAAAVLLLSHYDYTALAVLIVMLQPIYSWWRHGRSLTSAIGASPSAVIGLSMVVLIGLSSAPLGRPVFPPAVQIALTVFYGLWLIWLRRLQLHRQASLGALAVQQVAANSAIFLAAAFWHWSDAVVVTAVWAAIFVSTLWYLRLSGERAAVILATTWALIAAELAWVLYIWQVNYILLGGAVIVPQAVLVLLGVGYSFGSIYHSHTQKRLSRRRLIEYVAVGGVLLAIVVAGTRWGGPS